MMLNQPKTLAEARTIWGRTRALIPFCESKCAGEVYAYTTHQGCARFSVWVQCSRSPGHGPGDLYCRQHAKMMEEQE